MNFMRLPDEYAGDESFFAVVPIPYEYNPTFGDGASRGPKAILEAAEHLEYYDEQFGCEPFTKGVQLVDIASLPESPEDTIGRIAEVAGSLKGKFPIFIGGDHAITIGTVRGLEGEKEFDVLILDAHSDFRYSWNNSRLNHACVSRQLVEKHRVGIVGVRSQDIDEVREIEKDERITLIKAYDYDDELFEMFLNSLGDNIYISIDVDVFDSSFIRNTGTPEPGGLSWNQVISILKKTFEKKNIIGADVVEFAPKENYTAEAYALARLVYKIMALKMQRQ